MSNNIVCALQHLKLAKEYFSDWIREFPGTKGANLFSTYTKRIDWIFTDLKTHPAFGSIVLDGLQRELESDVFMVVAIHQKIAALPPEQRVEVEKMLDELIILHKANNFNNQTTEQ